MAEEKRGATQTHTKEDPADTDSVKEFWTNKRIGLSGLAVTVASLIVGLLIALGTFADHPYQRPTQPRSVGSAGDLGRYAASQLFWLARPTLFSASLDIAVGDLLNEAAGGTQTTLLMQASTLGQALAYSVPGVVSRAGLLDGQPVDVVGRLKAESPSTTNFNTGENPNFGIVDPVDIELTGPNNKGLVYGVAEHPIQGGLVGQVVYFPAVVVATGLARNGQTTAYIVGLEEPDFVGDYQDSGPTVPSLARQFQK